MRFSAERIVVTGAAGFIGSHLVDHLLEIGCEVVGVDSFTDYYSKELKLRNLAWARSQERLRFVEGDLMQLDLDELLSGVDKVVHLAGEPGVRSSWGNRFSTYLERNVRSTQHLLEACRREGVKRFIYASSSSVYGADKGGPLSEEDRLRPASPYGLTKLAAEELVRLYSREKWVPGTILRYFTVYGPRQRPDMALARFISLGSRGEPVEVFGDGWQMREMTYVSDVVDATVMALEVPGGGVYNVGGGERASVRRLIELAGEVLGERIKINYAPPVAGDVRSTWADSSLAFKKMGYKPRVGLEEGIEAQVRWALGEYRSLSLA